MADEIKIAVVTEAQPIQVVNVGVDTPLVVSVVVQEQEEIAHSVITETAQIQTAVIEETVTPVAVEVGIQGPPGVSSGEIHIHTQVAASDLWVINHNLGHRPIINLYTVGGIGMEGNVIHINSNQAQVLFASPLAGFATLT